MVRMTPRELMTDYLAAAKRGDWETAFGFFAEDVEVSIFEADQYLVDEVLHHGDNG